MNITDNKRIIYDDGEVIVVMQDEQNTANGELLLTTKEHFESLFDIDERMLAHIYEVLKKMKDLIYDRLCPDGLEIINDFGSLNKYGTLVIKIVPFYTPNQPLVDIDIIYDKLK